MDVVKHFGLSQNPFRTPEPGGLAGEALSPEAARAYLAGRAAGAGGRELFSPSALDLLAEAAQGQPDRLRQLGGNALFHAAFEGAARVEDVHARQAATAQGLWEPAERPMDRRPVVTPMTSTPLHTITPGGAAAATVAPAPDPVVVHRRWWKRTPPLTRLAIIVGLLLLSLPIVGFIIGAVKDSMSSNESSYLPEDSVVDEAAAPGAEEIAINPDAAAPEPTEAIVDRPIETSRPPVDLLERNAPADDPAPEPRESGLVVDDAAPVEAAPEPVEEPAPAPDIETVPIDPPPPLEEAPPLPQ